MIQESKAGLGFTTHGRGNVMAIQSVEDATEAAEAKHLLK
jgi:hypothetical protein